MVSFDIQADHEHIIVNKILPIINEDVRYILST
jgi:hypothetical protein